MVTAMITPRRDLLPHLMAIADQLEAGQASPPETLRATLCRASQALVEDQGLVATPAEVERAVDAHLVQIEQGEGPALPVFDFGWDRPASAEALATRRQKRDSWWRRLCRLGLPARHLDSFGGILLLALHLTFCFFSGVHLFALWSQGRPWPLILGGGLVTLLAVGMAALWTNDARHHHVEQPAPSLDPKERRKWKEWFVARDYIRHALASNGDLLMGDTLEIRHRIAVRHREIDNEMKRSTHAEQIRDMATW